MRKEGGSIAVRARSGYAVPRLRVVLVGVPLSLLAVTLAEGSHPLLWAATAAVVLGWTQLVGL